ncbi:MAG: VWA domain-containing protein [Deltaproteobacteria bacterium]|nr:VWA domain-containing protein [Deltaproteobacteria bacterium]
MKAGLRTRQALWLVLVAVAAVASGIAAQHYWPQAQAALAVHGVALARPWALGLAGLGWLIVAQLPWRLTDLPRWQVALQALLRALLLAVLAVALAGPESERLRPRRPQVVHLVDRSASVPDALLRAAEQGVLDSARALATWDKTHPREGDTAAPPLAVVAFDGTAVRLPIEPTLAALPSFVRAPETATATDLQAALALGLGLLDGHTVAHFVLWSDGLQTQGEALHSLGPLQAAGVQLHLPLLPPLPIQPEVLVEKLELPAKVRTGVRFALAATLQTNAAMLVRCAVTGPPDPPAPVVQQLQTGTQRVDLGQLRLTKPGFVDLAVECTSVTGQDRFASNNQLRARVAVEQRPRLLYVEGGGERQAVALTSALQDDFEVDTRPADGLPRSLGGLLPYQAVILSDVPRVDQLGVPLLTDGDMRNLESYVRQGGGLLVIGGENSLGSGGYQDTYLDKHVLPVHMDVESKVELPSIALMLAVDRSGSMAGPKIELAKAAALATAKALAPDDLIGVVAFDSESRLAVRLQRAGNSYRIESDIGKLTASGGTHIYPALDMAYQQLSSAQAKIKHVLLMTDGQAPRAGIDALVRQMRRGNITVSAVGVGGDVDRNLLESIADRGGGRAYFTDRPENLPRIFVRETKMLHGESVVEKAVQARVAPGLGRVDLLRGVHISEAPNLLGFLPTRVKSGAEEILRLNNGKPLLVRWRLGQGKVSVWTSDLKNRWATAWTRWPDHARLCRQIVRDVLQEELGLDVAVRLLRERDRLRVVVDAIDDDGTWLQGMVGEASLRGPDGKVAMLPLSEVATGRYEAVVPLTSVGAYDAEARLRPPGQQRVLASGRASVVHPYPDELRISTGEVGVGPELAKATGGKPNSQPADWLDTRGLTHQARTPLWPELVSLAALLLLLDVLLRRIRLGRAPSVRWHALRRTRL